MELLQSWDFCVDIKETQVINAVILAGTHNYWQIEQDFLHPSTTIYSIIAVIPQTFSRG